MTEMQPYQAPQQQLAFQDVAVQRLAEWAQSASAAYEVARRLVSTSFCPVAYRGKPEEATAAILAGIEVGLAPMSALRAFDVISGQAAPRAITLRAVVQSRGHEMVLVESTETRCRMRGRRRGTDDWQTVNWTIDRAKTLGLTGKDNWRKQPGAMLVARATSELARLIASDAILGIGYSSEEIADGGTYDIAGETTDPTPTPTATAKAGTRRMSRKPAPRPELVAELPPDPTDPDDGPEMITPAQMRKMQATYNDLGLTYRDERLADASAFLGRDLATSNDLTKDDARRLIDYLELRQQGTDDVEPDEYADSP